MLCLKVHELQAWAVLEAADGNTQLARQLFKCAVKADPSSEPSWLVRTPAPGWPNTLMIASLSRPQHTCHSCLSRRKGKSSS